MTARHRSRRGFSLFEVVLAGMLGLLVLTGLVGFTYQSLHVFAGTSSNSDVQREVENAMQTLAKDIRAARQLTVALANGGNTVSLQLPAYDASGNIVLPPTNGSVVTYSVSTDGTTILRTIGTSSTTVASIPGGSVSLSFGYTWQDLNSNGAVDLNEYVSLTPTITARAPTAGSGASCSTPFSTSQTVILRNR